MPRALLSRDKIIDAAIHLADREGLEAVSLRGLAKQLKVHVTSLYNHIPTKEALLAAMIEALVAESGLPVGNITWQDWVRGVAAAVRELARRHPGAFRLLQQAPAQGERAMQSVESAIAAFQADGFDARSTDCAIRAVNVAVLGMVLDDLESHRRPAVSAELSRLPAGRYPQIHRLLAVGDDADSFQFLVDVLILGIAANRNRAQPVQGQSRE